MRLAKGWSLAFFGLWFCCSVLLVAGQEITDPTEIKALRIIKNNLIDPNGNLSSWNQGDPCTSNWTGVVCFNRTLVDGYLHVRELRLMGLSLSGNLAPEIGRLAYMEILNFMWNNITGSIPKEIGNINSLSLLLLNGNQLTGELPEELGYLPNLDRIQIDQNHISGSIPKSFANLNKTQYFHMNNNSITGQIPRELFSLPLLIHILLDNNNLSGPLPPELSQLPSLRILQLDNNDLGGSTIPDSYGKMSTLLKLSLRNCNLQGHIPDFSTIPRLCYLDLSSNQLNGTIPSNRLSENITTIDLSNNKLTGTIPSNFSSLPNLHRLSVANNSLNESVPSTIWQNSIIITLDFQNNNFTDISDTANLPSNATLWLGGNPLCSNNSLAQFCGSKSANDTETLSQTNSTGECRIQSCPPPYEYSEALPGECFCAAPFLLGFKLKSPGYADFRPITDIFKTHMTNAISVNFFQLYIESIRWQVGPRLLMYLKIFPTYVGTNSSNTFNGSEIQRLVNLFTGYEMPCNDLCGPYDLINYTLLDPYRNVIIPSSSSGLSKGAWVGIILGVIASSVILFAIVTLIILRVHKQNNHAVSKQRRLSRTSIQIDGVRSFTYEEMALATNNFSDSTQVGQGGYGKVYKGVLTDGTVVAIKRAQEVSLQGEREFLTEIQLLSRLHHRNLVSLVGYCDEESEQMLVYEFMSNGTLRDHLSVHSKDPPSFAMRLRIALESAKGILYLHTEADPPIFHRDIKATNILLDSKFIAKVADFGLSRLAPVPDIEGVVSTHVSTMVKGTPGYLDPEYFLTHKLTDKSDVYGLGVVFLELLTGMQPISHGKNIVREVNVAYESNEIFSIIDGRMGSYPSDYVEKFLNLALKCCQDEPDARPKMAEVVRELENIWAMMPESDNKRAWSITNDSGKIDSSPPSFFTIRNPFISSDASGSDLISGAVPTIAPR